MNAWRSGGDISLQAVGETPAGREREEGGSRDGGDLERWGLLERRGGELSPEGMGGGSI